MGLEYRGHVFVQGEPRNMRDYVPPQPDAICTTPMVLIIGTSMDAGKTASAKVLFRNSWLTPATSRTFSRYTT